jgi:hypothetical protein
LSKELVSSGGLVRHRGIKHIGVGIVRQRAELKRAKRVSFETRSWLPAHSPPKSALSPCPVCKTGGERAIVITPDKFVFYCFSAKVGGDAIALVSHIKGVSFSENRCINVEIIGNIYETRHLLTNEK